MWPIWYGCCPCIVIFAIKKVKIAKNKLYKKEFIAGISAIALALQFLQIKKQT